MLNKFDDRMMETAYIWAEASYCERRKVGAVISKDNRIITHGYNGTISGLPNQCEDVFLECIKCGNEILVETGYPDLDNNGTLYDTDCPHCDYVNTYIDSEDSHISIKKYLKRKTNEFVVHAEQNALMDAVRQGKSVNGAILYTTTSPCKQCSKLIASSGIVKVIYKEIYKDTAGIDLLNMVGIETVKYDKEISVCFTRKE